MSSWGKEWVGLCKLPEIGSWFATIFKCCGSEESASRRIRDSSHEKEEPDKLIVKKKNILKSMN